MTDYTALSDAEIAALCAEKVMGWEVFRAYGTWTADTESGFHHYPTTFNPAASIADAMRVAEKMVERGHSVATMSRTDGYHSVFVSNQDEGTCEAHTGKSLSSAICIAALRAVEGDGK